MLSSSEMSYDDAFESFDEPEGEYEPVFIRYKRNLARKLRVVIANDKVRLPCLAKGNPEPTITWVRKNGISLDENRVSDMISST